MQADRERSERELSASKASDREYHNGYYGSREVSDEDLVVRIEGFRESLRQNPIGDLYAFLLGNMRDFTNKTVLDYGCGEGQVGVFFALCGARVHGFDFSEHGVATAKRRAQVNKISSKASFLTMSANMLAYRDEKFDFIVGRWILHHLDKALLESCGKEINRVLKRGGKAFFIEPLGNNYLIEFVRRHPFYGKGDYDSPQETTMKMQEILTLGKAFASVQVHPFHLFSMLKRVVGNRLVIESLKGIDHVLLGCFPFLRRYRGECVIELVKA